MLISEAVETEKQRDSTMETDTDKRLLLRFCADTQQISMQVQQCFSEVYLSAVASYSKYAE